MSIIDVCRLCSAKENLVWLFDKTLGYNKNMSDVVFITTGVEVHVYDIVSQKICKKCLQTTTDMFEFRKRSLENDIRLKEKCAQYLNDNNMRIPNTDIVTKTENSQVMKQTKETYKPTIKMHASIKDLFQMYPRIKLPTVSLNYDVAPIVCMPMNEVEDYFKSHNMDLNKYTNALKLKHTNLRIPKKAENKTTNVIPPIKIKLTSSKATYEIINSSNNKDINVQRINTDSIKESQHSLETDVLRRMLYRKRKLSEESSETEYNNKATLIASLGLRPKLNVNTSSTENTSSIPDKSASQIVCNICNAVKYSTKDFRKHQNKHLRCHFCRTKFRTVEYKIQHVDNCVIKNVINNLPYIEVDKIENDLEVRKMYPTAFGDFPRSVACDSLDNFQDSEVAGTLPFVEPSEKVDRRVTDLTNEKLSVTTENTVKVECDDVDSSEEPLPEVKNNYVILSNKTEAHTSLTSTSCLTDKVSQQNVTTNKILIIKPHVKIKYDSILEKWDTKSSDINVLKNLLTNYKSLKLLRDKNTQTEISTDRNVIVDSQEISAEFTHLQQLMHVHPIPVVIHNGPFNVSFNDNPSSLGQPKKMHLWDDLTPIEIKINSTNISDCISRTDDDLKKLDHHNNNAVIHPPNHNSSTENQVTIKSSLVASNHFNGNDISNKFQNSCDISCINTNRDPPPNIFPGIIRVKNMSELV